jgi:predicted transposase/invertase (TIGR01784 family)
LLSESEEYSSKALALNRSKYLHFFGTINVMKHKIDPKIDCVFKALLGSEENRNLLVHFLNAVLNAELPEPITSVEILNPYNDKEFLDDKLSIVDVKARDNKERIYQIEIQLLNYDNLPSRIIYGWSDIYSQQLKDGKNYLQLKPTFSIWLLGKNLIKTDNNYLHTYKLRDEEGQVLVEHGAILLLEIEKFHASHIENERERWLQFFKEGESLDDETQLPDWMITEEMRQAMNTLRQFSEKERDYHAYQARQNFIREQSTIQEELQMARMREQQITAERDAIKAENEKLKALLAAQQS